MNLEDFVGDARLAMAGIIGAIAAAPLHSDVKGWKAKTVFVLGGLGASYFLTGIVADYFHVEPDKAGGIGFLLGAFSGSLLDAGTKAIRATDLGALLRARLGIPAKKDES